MKLLLTSNGFSNQDIADALGDLLGKPLTEASLVFVPTASNVEMGDKGWFIDDLINIKKQNFTSVHIADISAVEESVWRPQLEEADVLFFEGGNTYHLMRWMNKTGLTALIPELLKSKVYVGLSAGSMVTGPDLALRLSQVIYGEDMEEEPMEGLNLVDFYVLPHLNSPYFPSRMEENITEAAKTLSRKIYALSDQTALKVVDGKVEAVVGSGKHLEFN